MRTLRSLPFVFILVLVACGGGTVPVDGVAKQRVTVTISPSKATQPFRGVQQFTATMNGSHNRGVSWSTTAQPFVWTKTADAILGSIGRFASRTLEVHGANDM